jgi:uncharacterized protein YjbI with pentapeptide repeats
VPSWYWPTIESDFQRIREEAYSHEEVLTSLLGTNLEGANLTKSDLRGADLSGANLSNAILKGANLSQILMNQHRDFKGFAVESDFEPTNLNDANLINADFEGANLRGAELTGARLEGANFKGAELQDVIGYQPWRPPGKPRNRRS